MVSKSPQNTDPLDESGSGSKSKSKKKLTPEEQSAQFIKTARELECDETGKAFKRTMNFVKNSNRTPP